MNKSIEQLVAEFIERFAVNEYDCRGTKHNIESFLKKSIISLVQKAKEEERERIIYWINHNNAGLMNTGYNKAMSDLRKFLSSLSK